MMLSCKQGVSQIILGLTMFHVLYIVHSSTCPKLTETNSSYYQCTIDNETGLETCSVRCKDGYILGPWANGFRNLSCGMQTGFHWLPANITLHCSDPIMPQHLLLESSIEYNELIPSKYRDMAKIYVRNKVLHTDCFNSTRCTVDVSLIEVNQVNATDDAYKRSKLFLSFQRDVISITTNNDTTEVAEAELNNALEDMESTAKYLKEFTSDVFDIYISSTSRRRSVILFTTEETSLDIYGNVSCENGQPALYGMCIECPPGTYTYGEKCLFCNKSTYQPDTGLITCIICQPGLATDTIGAYHILDCRDEETTIIVFPNENGDSNLKETHLIVGIVSGIMFILGLIPCCCCKGQDGERINVYCFMYIYCCKRGHRKTDSKVSSLPTKNEQKEQMKSGKVSSGRDDGKDKGQPGSSETPKDKENKTERGLDESSLSTNNRDNNGDKEQLPRCERLPPIKRTDEKESEQTKPLGQEMQCYEKVPPIPQKNEKATNKRNPKQNHRANWLSNY